MSTSSSEDRSPLCSYVFADGRCCKLPQTAFGAGYCYFHAQRERARLNTRDASREISHFLNSDIHTACELNSAFAALFAATVQGHIKPKTTSALTRLGQLMLQTQQLAKQEFEDAFESSWSDVVQESISFEDSASEPDNSGEPDSSDVTDSDADSLSDESKDADPESAGSETSPADSTPAKIM